MYAVHKKEQNRVSALVDTVCSGLDSEGSLGYILKTAPLVDYTHNYKTWTKLIFKSNLS